MKVVAAVAPLSITTSNEWEQVSGIRIASINVKSQYFDITKLVRCFLMGGNY